VVGIELLTGHMIKNPRHWFESNNMDRYLVSSSPNSSGSINELWEEDLWLVDIEEADLKAVQDRKENNCKDGQFVTYSTGFHASLRMIPRFADSSPDAGLRHHHQSAPVDVPYWSKNIPGFDRRKEQNPDADDFDMDMAGNEEEERLPPHEYLAREHAHCQIFSTSSVWVGVGLKGREMSRVRNAVWRQTGFLG